MCRVCVGVCCCVLLLRVGRRLECWRPDVLTPPSAPSFFTPPPTITLKKQHAGVILNRDPDAHKKFLKPSPVASDLVNRCIECGFCESNCPSRDLTLTPRQRIATFKEISRLRALPSKTADEAARCAAAALFFLPLCSGGRGRARRFGLRAGALLLAACVSRRSCSRRPFTI